jgi:hypothetical protein
VLCIDKARFFAHASLSLSLSPSLSLLCNMTIDDAPATIEMHDTGYAMPRVVALAPTTDLARQRINNRLPSIAFLGIHVVLFVLFVAWVGVSAAPLGIAFLVTSIVVGITGVLNVMLRDNKIVAIVHALAVIGEVILCCLGLVFDALGLLYMLHYWDLLLNKSLVTVVMSLAFIGTIGSLFNSFGWLVATAWQLKALHDIQKAEQQLPTTIVSQGVPNELAHSSSLY